MSLGFAPSPRRRRLSLTPLIDVVFLLLVFFMLAARFGMEGAITLGTAGAAAVYDGPPRLVALTAGGITLNGRPLPAGMLADALARLTSAPTDAILIRAEPGVPLQELTDVISRLNQAGFANLVLIE